MSDSEKKHETLADWMSTEMPPMRWIVPDLLPEGLIILAGRPKVGKSWLALNWGIAVSQGNPVLGRELDKARGCLFFALEDSKQRLTQRSLALGSPALNNFFPKQNLLQLNLGGLNQIRAVLDDEPGIGLVIVDTLGRVLPPLKHNQRLYSADVEMVAGLQKITQDYRIAMMLTHHEKKLKDAGDHFVDLISGTHGIAGTADVIMVLTTRGRKNADAILHVTGRDVQEQEIPMRFSEGIWSAVSEPLEIAKPGEREQEVLSLFGGDRNVTVTSSDLVSHFGVTPENSRKILERMTKKGVILGNYGKYTLK